MSLLHDFQRFAIRVWSAACASGEETYSLAMLLEEALGLEQFQKRVRIYGTDVDRDALLQARRGYYSSRAVELISPNLLERYFERRTDGYRWRNDLSHTIIDRQLRVFTKVPDAHRNNRLLPIAFCS